MGSQQPGLYACTRWQNVTCCLVDGGEWREGRRGEGQFQTSVHSEIRMRGTVYDSTSIKSK